MWANANILQDLLGMLVLLGLVGLGLSVRSRYASLPGSTFLPEWNIRLSSFALLFWVILVVFFVLPSELVSDRFRSGEEIDVVAWNGMLAALATHLPVCVLFASLLLVSAGRRLLGTLTTEPRESWGGVIRRTGLVFLEGLPLLIGVSFLWHMLLLLLEVFGVQVDRDSQLFVRIMMEAGDRWVVGLLAFSAIVVAPISEEFIFRGVLFRFLKTQFSGYRLAAWISGIIFACVHLNVSAFASLAVLGYLFARAYEHSADIRVPILYHALFNGVMTTLVLILPQNTNLT